MLIKCPVCGEQYDLGPGRYQCVCGIKFCIDLKENVVAEDPSASGDEEHVVLNAPASPAASAAPAAPAAPAGAPLSESAGRDSGGKPGPLNDPRRGAKTGVGDLILGRYKVLAELARRGAGVVYRCFDETRRLEVAVKALPPELSHNAEEMEEIRKTFRVVQGLFHPNIAAVESLEKDPVTCDHFLVMEYVEGENLRKWLRHKRGENDLTPETVLPVIRQIAEALDCAHEREIFHCELKPENIMITRAGRVKVLDFGVSAQIRIGLTRILPPRSLNS